MCDYSLDGHESREAKKGDLLVTSKLGEHRVIGLVSPDEPAIAVCLIPGTRLQVMGTVPTGLTDTYGMMTGDIVVFSQRLVVNNYRDGLLFDRKTSRPLVLFQEILDGLMLEVVSIPASQAPVEEPTRAHELELA